MDDLRIPINFFPIDGLKKIALNCAKIHTAEGFNTALGAGRRPPTSPLTLYALDIVKIIHDEAEAEKYNLPEYHVASPPVTGSAGGMTGQPKMKAPPKPRKRKYDGVVPEHLLNPDGPKDALFPVEQKEILAYDQQIPELKFANGLSSRMGRNIHNRGRELGARA